MAEAIAALGAVAAVSQLTGNLVKLTTNLRHHIKVIRRAPEEIQAFLMETSNFTGLLNFFAELADNPTQNVDRRGRRKRERWISNVQNQCAYVCDKMEYVVERFASLADGSVTPLESFIERIKYLLDKPDIKDLRLSVQLATTTINTMSTLFLWEQAKQNGPRSDTLLEQLRNLLSMEKKASSELALHQQRHGVMYEYGAPEPNNAILAASEEIQRQVAHVIRQYPRPKDTNNKRWGQNPRDSLGEPNGPSGPPTSPSGSGGSAAVSIQRTPRRRVKRPSIDTSTGSGHSYLGDHGFGVPQDGAPAEQASPRGLQSPHSDFPSSPADSAKYISEGGSDRTSTDERRRTEANKMTHDDDSAGAHPLRPHTSRAYFTLDISDPMKPLIHPCNHSSVSLCDPAHCSWGDCPFAKRVDPTTDEKLDGDASQGLVAPLKAGKTSSSKRGSHDSTRSFREEQARHGSHMGPVIPSSKSSIPSRDSPNEPEAKNREFTIMPHDPDKTRNSETKVSGLAEKRPQELPQQEQEQRQGKGKGAIYGDKEKQRLAAREKLSKEYERWTGSEAAPYEPHVSDDGDASSVEGPPSPYVPMAPFGGPGGRRRPRRPRSDMDW